MDLREYTVVAHNTATASTNKIHDDTVARRYGFAGGLVPGVDVYAYLTHPPAEGWGLDWLRQGSVRARFVTPVYDGDEVTVMPADTAQPDQPGDGWAVALQVSNSAGVVCATGEARLPSQPDPAPDGSAWNWSAVEPADDPRPASPETLAPGTSLALAPHAFRADRAGEYLEDVREELPVYRDAGVAHPGWLLRDANYVLSANVVLGPWIHVESVVQHHQLVLDGDVISTRAVVTREWAHKGHRFVELDVGLFLDDDRLAARITHTAIYQPASRAG